MDLDWFVDGLDDTFITFLKKTPDALKSYEEMIKTLKGVELNALNGQGIPADLLEQFDKFEAEQFALSFTLGEVKKYIAMKCPEIKEEDNAGVRVQEIVIGYINRALKGGSRGSKEDDNSDASLSGASKMEYLSSRGKIEKAKADNAEIATYQLQLKELDRQAYQKLIFAWQNLVFHRASVYTQIKLNREKIDNPRRKEYGMSL
jgi:hypothetical protein